MRGWEVVSLPSFPGSLRAEACLAAWGRLNTRPGQGEPKSVWAIATCPPTSCPLLQHATIL